MKKVERSKATSDFWQFGILRSHFQHSPQSKSGE